MGIRRDKRRLVLFVVSSMFVLFFSVVIVLALPGDLDPGFGLGGVVTTDLGANDEVSVLVVQPDGKVIAVGTSFAGTGTRFALARYLADGRLDASFGGGGTVTTSVAGTVQLFGAARQSEGKIIAVGTVLTGANLDFAVLRYQADGILDSGFGAAGLVTTDIASGQEEARAVAIQPDGKILVVGFTVQGAESSFALARYQANGSLDSSFGVGGIRTTNLPTTLHDLRAVAIQTDGKIVVAGSAFNGFQTNFALARYHESGSLDTSFGVGGIVITDVSGVFVESFATAVLIRPDDRIVVGGVASDGSDRNFALARYLPSGVLDRFFGTSGLVRTDFSGQHELSGIALQSDLKIVAAGSTMGAGGEFVVARYNEDGSLHSAFGTGGVTRMNINGRPAAAQAVAIQADGGILAAGRASNGTDADFAVVRHSGRFPSGTDLAVIRPPTAEGGILDDVVIPGQFLGWNWTVTVRNNGPDPATEVVLVEDLLFTPFSGQVTPSQGSCQITDPRRITCVLGAIAPDAVVQVSMAFTHDRIRGGITGSATTISSNETDPDPTNNQGRSSVVYSVYCPLCVTTTTTRIWGTTTTWVPTTTTTQVTSTTTATTTVLGSTTTTTSFSRPGRPPRPPRPTITR